PPAAAPAWAGPPPAAAPPSAPWTPPPDPAPAPYIPPPETPKYAATSVLAASDAPQTDFASTAFDHQAMSFEAAPSAGAAPQGSTWGVGPAPSAASAPPPVAGQPPRPAAGAPIPQSDTALK